ncbi:MAG: prepilin-type N-terminal cleavage/methylation domain-containing protein [Opitutaceae bacterium]|nr:prepilin-type N-terminal cleavage/methylation domain-containing protein [Opitutaceae bacterium]
MTISSFNSATRRRPICAFTLVEIMVVVVLIGLLAAMSLPTYRHITMRSKATALENDLRAFSTAFLTYNLQNGRWPADAAPQVIPPEVANALPVAFTQKSPIGGVYKWNYDVPADGVNAKAAIVVMSVTGNLVSDDIAQLEMIDKQMDDGDLYASSGHIQIGSTNSLVFIIEK